MSHWTEELFKKHPELFLKPMEERIDEAKCEVELLLEHLREQGFKPKNVLDLNCGIGRHSVELGRRGINVVGTDLSSYYIRVAKERAKSEGVEDKVRFKVADMRRIASALSGERPFDGVINLFTSFGYYDDETNADVLRQCSKLVLPRGFFALEIMNRDWIVRNFQKRGFSRYEGLIVLEDREFESKTSRLRAAWTCLLQKDDKNFVLEKPIAIDTRIWSLHELIELFGENGWEFKTAYPGFGRQQGDVPTVEAKRLLFIGEKTSDRLRNFEKKGSQCPG